MSSDEADRKRHIIVHCDTSKVRIARQGWWHYAVALDASITVMQNFYHAPTNAAGMVQLVLKSIAGLKEKATG